MHTISLVEAGDCPNRLAHVARVLLGGALIVSVLSQTAMAQKVEMRHGRMRLTHILPTGGQRGTAVKVRLHGWRDGLEGASGIVIDGPGGVKATDFKLKNDELAIATLKIAEDAPLGRRMIRVRGGVAGLTNYQWFIVGRLPERTEQEDNDRPESAERVDAPLVIHGRIGRDLDRDHYRFRGGAGERIVAGILADRLGSMNDHWRQNESADLTLELLDEAGGIIADAGDTVGLDPVIATELPADGRYILRVKGMGYKGFPAQVYRLTLGDVSYPVAAFPAGGRCGETVKARFLGYNVPQSLKRTITIGDDPMRCQWVQGPQPAAGIVSVPMLRSETPETIESEPNDVRETATVIEQPVTANGRMNRPGDVDWYRIDLQKNEALIVQTVSQRRLRTPLDTRLDVFGPDGEKRRSNDDIEGVSEAGADFSQPFDSWLTLEANKAGSHFIRVTEQTGSVGPQAVYRLDVQKRQPDFRLYQWPDAVPIWGPGSTAALIVDIERWGGLKGPIEMRVDGLPDGWSGSTHIVHFDDHHPRRRYQGPRRMLTITAPQDAERGDLAEFRVVGVAKQGDRTIRRIARPLTLLGSWRGPHRKRLRPSPVARAAVGKRHTPWFEPTLTHVKATAEQKTVEVPLKVRGVKPGESVPVSIDRVGSRTRCAFMSPKQVKVGANGEARIAVKVADRDPGSYYIVISKRWVSQIRKGLPGPCTQLIRIEVAEKAEVAKQE